MYVVKDIVLFFINCMSEIQNLPYFIYLVHTKNNGIETIASYGRLEKILFLHTQIVQIMLYNSTAFHHSPANRIIIKVRCAKLCIETIWNRPKYRIPLT